MAAYECFRPAAPDVGPILDQLRDYDWPENLVEFRDVIARWVQQQFDASTEDRKDLRLPKEPIKPVPVIVTRADPPDADAPQENPLTPLAALTIAQDCKTVPSLRSRGTRSIRANILYFLRGLPISPGEVTTFANASWPGNVEQLRCNLRSYARDVINNNGKRRQADFLPKLPGQAATQTTSTTAATALQRRLASEEIDIVVDVLARHLEEGGSLDASVRKLTRDLRTKYPDLAGYLDVDRKQAQKLARLVTQARNKDAVWRRLEPRIEKVDPAYYGRLPVLVRRTWGLGPT